MKTTTCMICGKPMPGPILEWPDFPFCSARCRTIDLGRWLGEEYRLPSAERPGTPADDGEDS